jgi:hypothetical protein
VPNKTILAPDELNADQNGTVTPVISPTPFTTWEESQNGIQPTKPQDLKPEDVPEKMVSVMVCDITGMKATAYCPKKRLKTFKVSEQPKDNCTFHIYPPD